MVTRPGMSTFSHDAIRILASPLAAHRGVSILSILNRPNSRIAIAKRRIIELQDLWNDKNNE